MDKLSLIHFYPQMKLLALSKKASYYENSSVDILKDKEYLYELNTFINSFLASQHSSPEDLVNAEQIEESFLHILAFDMAINIIDIKPFYHELFEKVYSNELSINEFITRINETAIEEAFHLVQFSSNEINDQTVIMHYNDILWELGDKSDHLSPYRLLKNESSVLPSILYSLEQYTDDKGLDEMKRLLTGFNIEHNIQLSISAKELFALLFNEKVERELNSSALNNDEFLKVFSKKVKYKRGFTSIKTLVDYQTRKERIKNTDYEVVKRFKEHLERN